MIENILAGLHLFWGVENFIAITVGVFIGVLVGMIPGLTATMAVALALPLTFAMTPTTGILLLIGVYKGGVFGGSISAILLRAPGTPAAAATLLDGYPLAQQGKAGKAMKMALYSSCIADFISNISLIFFAGLIAGLALAFGPPEFFWLICFSLTVVVSISGASLTKGLISGALGLLVSTIGLDLVQGSERLSFGNFNLMGGVGYIALLIGLFAMPEIIDFYVRKSKQLAVKVADASTVTRQEFKNSISAIVRGSFIGVIIGTIPGAGATAAAFLSYGEAKRSSKKPDEFGKGSLEGVAAAESGNNGVTGATMIPLLSLGIPGDVVTAVILGAFLIHGLSPGPLMFKENIDLIYALFIGIMLSSIVLFIVGSAAIKYFVRIADIPKHILMPIILLFCVFGTYAVQSQMFDVLMMMIFGVLGYIMMRIGMSAAPFLMGFILGPLLEDNLRRSYLISDGSMLVFIRSPICWIFIALTLISLFIGLRREFRRHSLSTH